MHLNEYITVYKYNACMTHFLEPWNQICVHFPNNCTLMTIYWDNLADHAGIVLHAGLKK